MNQVLALVRRAVVFEISLYRSLFRWATRRYDVPPGAERYPYVGAVSVLLWAFIVVSAVELVVFHVILPWEVVRLVVDVVSLWGLAWMIGLAASFYVYPHLVTPDGLRVRHGSRTDLTVPWDDIAAIGVRERGRERSRALQVDSTDDGTVLNVVIASRTNVDVRLRRPLTVRLPRGEETVTEVRLLAEDARALVRRAREHLEATSTR